MSHNPQSPEASFRVGETLKCLQYVERKDGQSSIKAGDLVKVLQEFTFQFEDKTLQDLTIQHEDDIPIAVIAKPGRFARLTDAS